MWTIYRQNAVSQAWGQLEDFMCCELKYKCQKEFHVTLLTGANSLITRRRQPRLLIFAFFSFGRDESDRLQRQKNILMPARVSEMREKSSSTEPIEPH